MRMAAVMSTASRDDFSETLVVLEAATPLNASDLADEGLTAAVLARAAQPVIGTDDPPLTFGRELIGDKAVVYGSWQVDDLSYRIALAPWGPKHSMVVLVTRAAEEALYRSVFSDIVAGLDGVLAPVTPFALKTWRIGALVIWLVVALLAYLIVAAAADRAGDYVPNGRRTAFALLMLAVVAGGLAFVVLGGQLTELRVADVSRERVVGEVTGLGGVMALLIVLVTRWLGRPRMIASAPGVGAFAGKTGAFKAAKGLYDSSGVDLVKVDSSESPARLTPEPPEPGDVSGPMAMERAPVELPGVETAEPVLGQDVEAQVDAAVDAMIEPTPDPDTGPEAIARRTPRPAPPGDKPAPPTIPSPPPRTPVPGVVELPDATDEIMEVDAVLQEVESALESRGGEATPADDAKTVVRKSPVPARVEDEGDTARRELAEPVDDEMKTVARPAPTGPKQRPSPWRRRPVSEYSVRTVKPRGSGPKK
jgi:hypothetical protein